MSRPKTIASSLWDSLRLDVRRVLRQIRNSFAFSAIVVVLLATGLSVATAIFSTVRTVLLSPLPYKDSEQLVQIISTWPRTPAAISIPRDERRPQCEGRAAAGTNRRPNQCATPCIACSRRAHSASHLRECCEPASRQRPIQCTRIGSAHGPRGECLAGCANPSASRPRAFYLRLPAGSPAFHRDFEIPYSARSHRCSTAGRCTHRFAGTCF